MSCVINSLVCGLFQDELAEQTLKAMCRKFSTSAKVWLRHVCWLLTKDRADAARKVMDKSFDALPQRKHIKASALPCPAPSPLPSPLFFLLVCISLCHPSRHSTRSHSVCSASTHLNTMLAVIVALAILVILATCFLGDARVFGWSYIEQRQSLESCECADIGD